MKLGGYEIVNQMVSISKSEEATLAQHLALYIAQRRTFYIASTSGRQFIMIV